MPFWLWCGSGVHARTIFPAGLRCVFTDAGGRAHTRSCRKAKLRPDGRGQPGHSESAWAAARRECLGPGNLWLKQRTDWKRRGSYDATILSHPGQKRHSGRAPTLQAEYRRAELWLLNNLLELHFGFANNHEFITLPNVDRSLSRDIDRSKDFLFFASRVQNIAYKNFSSLFCR